MASYRGIPVTPEEDQAWDERYPPLCAFDGTAAVAVLELSAGCVGRRNDRRQSVCVQHMVSCEPVGDVTIVGCWDPRVMAEGFMALR